MITKLNEKYKYVTQCLRCGCVLGFDDEDLKSKGRIKYLDCPICGEEIGFGLGDRIAIDIVGKGIPGFGYYKQEIFEGIDRIRSQLVRESPLYYE